MNGPVGLALTLAMLMAAVSAAADENKDLDLIPETARQPSTPSAAAPGAGDAARSIYLENALTFSSTRDGLLVPFPPPGPFTRQERVFLDVRDQWSSGTGISATLSDRFNVRAQDNLQFPTHENVVNDFREGYVSAQPVQGTYLDFGRINLKSGVALGYNPTDFFKTRAVTEPLSLDPSVLREDRLGTLMARGERIWDGGAVTAAFAPGLYKPTPLIGNVDLPSFNPLFGQTNGHDRFLLKSSVAMGNGFSPELLLYSESDQTRIGTNLTGSIGQSVIVYADWAGGRQTSLIDEALRFGRETGTLPASGPTVLPEDPHRAFRNEASLGASYTTATNTTFNAEYHYNGAGFSRSDWTSWFKAGDDTTGSSPIARELWYIRDYALDQQEPISRDTFFLRADRADAFIPKLELSGFVNVDLYDGSGLLQIAADYYLSNAWTIGGLVSTDFGGRHSDFGSLPQSSSMLLKVARYF